MYKNPEDYKRWRTEWRKRSKDKIKAQGARYYKRHPQRRAPSESKRQAVRRYCGLPNPSYPSTEHCELCGRLPTGRALALDHCHITGRFRGWLCMQCNTGLGKLGDTEASLKAALAYLQRKI